MQIVIKMIDPTKWNRGTHNHSTFIEVAGILIGKNNLYADVIERDIIIKTKKTGFNIYHTGILYIWLYNTLYCFLKN